MKDINEGLWWHDWQTSAIINSLLTSQGTRPSIITSVLRQTLLLRHVSVVIELTMRFHVVPSS